MNATRSNYTAGWEVKFQECVRAFCLTAGRRTNSLSFVLTRFELDGGGLNAAGCVLRAANEGTGVHGLAIIAERSNEQAAISEDMTRMRNASV